jgi:hypothetical protein
MSQDLDPIVDSAERLCETLERIGDALVSLDTQTLLETEETLGRVLAALASGGAVENKAALEPLIGRGREALLRCRRLGASLSGLARLRLQLHTGSETYSPRGEYVEPGYSGSAVRVRA